MKGLGSRSAQLSSDNTSTTAPVAQPEKKDNRLPIDSEARKANRTLPTPKVAAGWNTFALKNDGTVRAWGDNRFGQATVPPGLNDVIAISAGFRHSLALKIDGTVEAFAVDGRPILSVQYHPEAAPGPHDAGYLFGRFVELMERERRSAE